MDSSCTLIGMPGSGKSTLGVQLAKTLVRPFLDTDIQLQNRLGVSLQAYLDEFGVRALRQAEAECIAALDVQRHVIATGGSAVYSDTAMSFLRTHGQVIYLQISYASMCERLGDYAQRGIAADLARGLRPLFEERLPLYERYADVVIDADRSVPVVLEALLEVTSQAG